MQRQSDISTFYGLLSDLEIKMGGRRRLADCHGKMSWPKRGVYFFFERGEHRGGQKNMARVVCIGTHALKEGSQTTVWKRLSQHKGTANPYGGNHRGSIFRLLVGQALMQRNRALECASWGIKSNAPKDIRKNEISLEQKVSDTIGEMTLVVLSIPDESGPNSLRGVIKRNSIALLSGYNGGICDLPSKGWLGSYSGREKVRKSGLWNNDHVDETYEPEFLHIMEMLIEKVDIS